ncbi:MAG TPA: metallophosphoesterase [Gemmatimonadaceae bacterium]
MRHITVIAGLCVLAGTAAAQAVPGVVYLDRNANGRRDAGEAGVRGVAVSNQVDVATTDSSGAFVLPGRGTGVVFVSVPDGYRSSGRFWQPSSSASIAFGLVSAPASALTFVHASDTHIQPSAVVRFDRLRAIIDSVSPTFVLITGDLTRDALRVSEQEARGYYELFMREAARIPLPVWTVPGNHELFGIERHLSLVSASHPLYGREMYRHYLGPDYYSFTAGGVHFVGLNTADHLDLEYYGHVDTTQLRWLERDLAAVPSGTPIVTFNHIPLASAMPSIAGIWTEPPAPTLVRVKGKEQLRHVVSNLTELLQVVGPRPYPLALGGHNHAQEATRLGFEGRTPIRFEQTGAVVGHGGGGSLRMTSGVTVYRVRDGTISEGTFIRLDPPGR